MVGVDESKPIIHQLIVVGNGFDLECGLKSRFADFYEPRSELVGKACVTMISNPADALENSELTAWDFILRRGKYENWCDIETAIKEWVIPSRKNVEFSDYARRAASRMREGWKNDSFDFFQWSGDGLNENNLYLCLWVLAWTKMHEEAESLNEEGLLGLLKDELNRLELSFAEYLQSETKGNQDYQNQSDRLFDALCGDEMPNHFIPEYKTSVLTFNYTNPFSNRSPYLEFDSVVNIHGTLGSEIIFGIDGQECLDNQHALPFTKTYRVAVAGTRVTNELFFESQTGKPNVRTEMIKFYGHSLGEADYSYFQSIFDGVDLYGSSTKLLFYYRPWVENGQKVSWEVARTNMVNKVAKLLTAYGKTLDNKDHGKNLMHKLMLEGRLVIKPI